MSMGSRDHSPPTTAHLVDGVRQLVGGDVDGGEHHAAVS